MGRTDMHYSILQEPGQIPCIDSRQKNTLPQINNIIVI